jgi:phosphate starvation-inducible membrane PsiE
VLRKAIAGFKIREGMPVGVMVTLRSNRMYAFLNRLVNLTLYLEFVTFAVLAPKVLMDVATTPWGCESN